MPLSLMKRIADLTNENDDLRRENRYLRERMESIEDAWKSQQHMLQVYQKWVDDIVGGQIRLQPPAPILIDYSALGAEARTQFEEMLRKVKGHAMP